MQRLQNIDARVDYYDVLGVAASASDDEIRKSFKRLVLEYHPDKNPGRREWSEQRIRQLIEAYEVLGDADRRSAFDRRRRGAPRTVEPEPFFFRKKGPGARALKILHLMLHDGADEGVSLLEEMEARHGGCYLREYLEERDYLDTLFLLGEYYIRKKEYLAAFDRLRAFYQQEKDARYPRPYLPEVVRLLKDLYLRKLPRILPPKLLIGYLQEAATFELSPSEVLLRLRRLAEALIDLNDERAAREVLAKIESLDPEAKEAHRVESLLKASAGRRSASRG